MRSWLLTDWVDPRLVVPQRPFRGLIFDCDGTLVDSMPIHYVAWVESLIYHEAPFEFTEEEFYSLAGIREQDAVVILNEKYDADVNPEGVAEFKFNLFQKRLAEVPEITPISELARRAHQATMPIAVASGSEEATVRGVLQANDLERLFEVIITPKLVEKGKPAPDMFLLAAERLGLDPADCLVFEDGESGMQAARAAGMSAVFVPRTVR
jgi:HAD superfamily hydrolase (TIGR01509 family)